jgi:hypothetical protein
MQESNAKEITLKEDDPVAITIMLNFAYTYNRSFPLPDGHRGTTKNIRRIISLYRVEDKYDFPDFEGAPEDEFVEQFHAWLDEPTSQAGKDESAVTEFCSIVSDIYNLVGPDPLPKHPLVYSLLMVMEQREEYSILNNVGGNHLLLTRASQEVAEFGRDLFLDLIGKTKKVNKGESDGRCKATELYIGTEVKCPSCERVWPYVDHAGMDKDGYCPNCSNYVEDWTKHEWF